MNIVRRLTTSGFKTVVTTLIALLAGLGLDVITVSSSQMAVILLVAFIIKVIWKGADIDVEIRSNDKSLTFRERPGDSSRD